MSKYKADEDGNVWFGGTEVNASLDTHVAFGGADPWVMTFTELDDVKAMIVHLQEWVTRVESDATQNEIEI